MLRKVLKFNHFFTWFNSAVLLALLIILTISQQVQSFRVQGSLTVSRKTASGTLPGNVETTKPAEVTSHVKLKPLSFNPILVESSRPILSPYECQVLSSWVSAQPSLDFAALEAGLLKGEEGAKILASVQKLLCEVLVIDKNEIVMPKYLKYTYVGNVGDIQGNGSGDRRGTRYLKDYKVEDLLPDGLHVDTNNGKYFRHWTVLLYLNSCHRLGATTFPLAVPISGSDKRSWANSNYDEVHEAAKMLIDENVYHTRQIGGSADQSILGVKLDRAALALMIQDQEETDTTINNYGVRVMPRQGCFCLFSGLQRNGSPNPNSFHGGEAIFKGESKELLSFFYEVPPNGIMSLEALGEKVVKREERFVNSIGVANQSKRG